MKYDIFLSYSNLDRHIAEELQEKFKAGGLKCFLAANELKTGEEWLPKLRDAIGESKAIVILITPRSKESLWIYIEAAAAWMEDKIIIPVTQFVDVTQLPEVIKSFQAKSIETETDRLNVVHEIINQVKGPQIEVSLEFIMEQARLAKSKMDQNRFQPNLIIGSGRGGSICASMFAISFGHQPLRVVNFKPVGRGENRVVTIDESSLRSQDIADKNILIVEWARQTGKTFAAIKEKVLPLHPAAIQSYALFWTMRTDEPPDYYGIASRMPLLDPWSL